MVSKDCNAAGGRSQKICSARILQHRQLSMMSRPYGVSTMTPCNAPRIAAPGAAGWLVVTISGANLEVLRRRRGWHTLWRVCGHPVR